jgi:hypothetical protein
MHEDDYDECQAWLTRLQAEQRRVHELLSEARTQIESGKSASYKLLGAGQTLEKLRAELQRHFSEEERGGCLDEAVARAPCLASEASRLMGEHAELLHALDHLIELVMGPARMRGAKLETEFARLCHRLEEHEVKEFSLLQRSFGLRTNGGAKWGASPPTIRL